jgi:hypothetical protein
MARTQTAYLKRADVPALAALQKAVGSVGVKIAIDEAYVPLETQGYVPCTLQGEDSGCDIRFQNLPGEAEIPAPVQAALAGRDVAVVFRWSGDLREYVCAMALGAALAQNFGAIIYIPDDDALVTGDSLARKAKNSAGEI